MKKHLADIKEKTSGMGRRETCAYIMAYYWYHILGAVMVIALILLFAVHYGFGNQKPVFTCLIVNQAADGARDLQIRDGFAQKASLPKERVVIDSGCQFSYGEFRLEGVNESSYEKFFFQWRNGEIDAVVLSESFYQYCKELGGSFYSIQEEEAAGLELYMDGEKCSAVVLGADKFMEQVMGKKDEKLLLAFPVSGKGTEWSRDFFEYLCSRREMF